MTSSAEELCFRRVQLALYVVSLPGFFRRVYRGPTVSRHGLASQLNKSVKGLPLPSLPLWSASWSLMLVGGEVNVGLANA